MNERFLDKLFRIYSNINSIYAQKENIEKFLISSYYIKNTLIYTYECIDFELLYRVNNNISYTKKISNSDIESYLQNKQTKFPDIIVFLWEMYLKIINDLIDITEEDLFKLNNYYKKLF